MILKALYDYYHRSGDLPVLGMELKEIGFIIVIDKYGNFLRFEDRRIDKKSAQKFLVKKSVGRSSAPVANYLYDNEVVSKRWHNLFFTFYSPAIFSFAYDAFF